MLPTASPCIFIVLHRSVEWKKTSLEEDKAGQGLWVDLKPSECQRKIILIAMQRPHSFIMLCLHTVPQVILNLAIHHFISQTPAFLSYKSSSSQRPLGAEQGDTPPCYQHHWRWDVERQSKDGRREKGRKGHWVGNMEAREKVWSIYSAVTAGGKCLM